jgi:hypothetical protein
MIRLMFAFTRGTHYLDCNSVVTNSSITNSSIDMNGGVITNHGTPVNGTDVVNKDYVDSIAGTGNPVYTVTLTGTAYTLVVNLFKGVVRMQVKNIVTNGPSASFELSKSESSQDPSYVRTMSSAGIGTNERLHARWIPGSGIEIKKSGVNYDGQYKVKIDSLD